MNLQKPEAVRALVEKGAEVLPGDGTQQEFG